MGREESWKSEEKKNPTQWQWSIIPNAQREWIIYRQKSFSGLDHKEVIINLDKNSSHGVVGAKA